MKTIITCDGKYRTELNESGLIERVYRKDELWNRNFIGDGYVLSLIQRIEDLEDRIQSAQQVSGRISGTPDKDWW